MRSKLFPEETLTQLILIASLPKLGKFYRNKLISESGVNFHSSADNFACLNFTELNINLISAENRVNIFYYILFYSSFFQNLNQEFFYYYQLVCLYIVGILYKH